MLMRAPWRLIPPLLLVCVLAGCKHSQERRLSLSEIVKADSDVSARGQRVRTTAIVTYSDPEWRVLFVQDQQIGMYIGLPPNLEVQVGDRVQITGMTSSLGEGLASPSFSVLSRNNPLPPPIRVTDYSTLTGWFSQFVEVEGTVRWAEMKSGRLAVQLSSGEKLLEVYLREAAVDDLPSPGSEVSIAGVSAADVDSSNRVLPSAHLLTPSTQYIKVLKAGPADPFSLPLKRLSEPKTVHAGVMVHVTGRLPLGQEELSITDGKMSLPVGFQESMKGTSETSDVAGFWSGHGLEGAVARPLSNHLADNGDIVHLSDLKRLGEAAGSRRRVTVRAVVTYFDPAWGLLFVQDDTAAAYVDSHNLRLRLQPGDVVDVSGVSGAGGYAPIINEPKVGFVRRGYLPAPVRIDLILGNVAAGDSKWCSLRGVVHTISEQDGHTILKMGSGQTETNIQLPMLINGADLVDQEVFATGVFGVLFNERKQAIGHQIFVSSPAFLSVVDSTARRGAPATIESLQRYSPDTDGRHSVTLTGTVALKSDASTIFIQDRTAGIQVRGISPLNVSDGDRVSARGFVLAGEYSPVLEDAVVSVTASGSALKPELISAKTALEGRHDSGYVSMRAALAAVRPNADRTILVLNDKGTFFEAVGPASSDLDSLRAGSEVEIRGVCRVSFDRTRFSVNGFTLAFDSPQSVSVIKLGPWLDAYKITWALLLIVVVAASTFLWAALLQRQVETKTQELQYSIEAKRKGQKFDMARNQVLETIARNAPPPESMERLAVAVQEQIEGSLCAIALSPDGKSFLNGKPSPVVIAPDFPEELQREMLPLLSSVLDTSQGNPDQKSLRGDHDVMQSLLDISRRAGLDFKDGRLEITFSGGGELAGVLLIFFKNAPAAHARSAARSILESASRLVSLARDHWHMHERLVFDARHDALTGLPNRTLAEDRLEQALARARRRKQFFAVVCIDLDGFKAINDNLGHHGGDELLRAVSVRLRARIRHSDTLARIGGDEFLAIIEDCSGNSAAQSVAETLIAALEEQVALEGRTVSISGSIGVAMYPADGNNAAELKRNADQAMYRAKKCGGSQICFWRQEPTHAEKVAKRTSSSA